MAAAGLERRRVPAKLHGSTLSVSASHTAAKFALSGPDGHREVIVVNGREISLQAGTEVVVGLAGGTTMT